jgi:hypothetical protein
MTSLSHRDKEAAYPGTHGSRHLERELRERSAMAAGLDPADVSWPRSAGRGDTREAPPRARAPRGEAGRGLSWLPGVQQWRGGKVKGMNRSMAWWSQPLRVEDDLLFF